MHFPVCLRKVTKYGANGKKRMHQLSFPCRHHLSRTYDTTRAHLLLHHPHTRASMPTPLRICDTTRTQPPRHSRAPAPTPLRICDTTRTQPPHRSHASAPTPLRTCDTTRTQPRHHTHAPTPTPLRIRATTLAHLRPRRYASAPPHSRTYAHAATHPHHHTHTSTPTPLRTYATTRTQPRHHSRAPSSSIYTHWRPPLRTFVLHLYTLAPPLRNFVLPSLFRSLSESIRIYPSLSDILREISMGPD